MDGYVPPEGVFVFDRFRLDPVARSLACDGTRVPLAARLFDTLLYLVEHHGRLVSREELMLAIWPQRSVEDTSLGMAISSLRTALKQHGAPETLIVTAPGRGYRFGARVVFEPARQSAIAMTAGAMPAAAPAASGFHGRAISAAAMAGLAVAGLAVALCLIVVARLLPRHTPAASIAFNPPPHSIAVLPFANMTGDPAGIVFADGLSEELINALGRDGMLRVAARVSSFSFRQRDVTIAEIAQALNVGLVLEGSVRRDTSRIRVIAQLIDARTGFQLWSRSYDRDQGDLLALQGRIAEAAIESLKIVLQPAEAARLTQGSTANAQAFDSYLNGLLKIGQEDDAGNTGAVADFTTAIALDPNYALAYAQRARARAFLAANDLDTGVGASQAMLVAARQDATRAVAMAPDLGEAHAALGLVLKFSLTDFAQAGAEYARAVELSPGDATILTRYGQFELLLGHIPAAVEAIEHAVALDPLAPAGYHTLARVLAYAGRYDEALATLQRARKLQPANPAGDHDDLAFVQWLRGDARGAQATCASNAGLHDFLCLAWAYHALGRTEAAEAALARAQAQGGDKGAYVYACIYAQWDRPVEALRWLQTAYRLRDPGLTGLLVDPMLQTLRETAGYRDIKRGLGFPP